MPILTLALPLWGLVSLAAGFVLYALWSEGARQERNRFARTFHMATCNFICGVIALNGILAVGGLQIGGKRLDRMSYYHYMERHVAQHGQNNGPLRWPTQLDLRL